MHARIFQTTCNEQIICPTTVLRHQTKLKTYRMFTIQILYLHNPIQKRFFKKREFIVVNKFIENFRASAPPFVVKHDLFKLKIYLENNKSTGKEVKQECLSLY